MLNSMLNVNSIQDRLAGMSLPELQQYAQLNKNDPFIVTMALHVANLKRKLDTAKQGQPTPPQPPVVDQAIAQMAPEQVGIGSLPEQSLAKMAGGGIVAFEEGGEVEHYAAGDLIGDKGFLDFLQKNGKTVRDFVNALPSEQAAIKAAYTGPVAPTATVPPVTAPTTAGAASSFKAGLGAVSRSPLLGLATQLFGTSDEELAVLRAADKKREDEAQQKYDQDVAAGRLPAGPIGKSTFSTDVSQRRLRDIAFDKDKTPIPLPKDYADKTAAPVEQALPPGIAALKESVAGEGKATGPGIGVPATPNLPSIKSFMPEETKDPFRQQRESMWNDIKKVREGSLAQFDKDIKEAGLFGAEREKRLKEREEKLGKQEGENTGLALLKAGFAIMAGTSPHAMANIGTGANVGVDEFVKGREKIDAAREKLDDAFSRIDEMRRSETMMNARERRGLQKDIDSTIAEAKRDYIAGAEKAHGLDRQDAGKMFEATTNAMLKKQELDAAAARTKALIGSQERLGLAQLEARYGDENRARNEFMKIQQQVQSSLKNNAMYTMEQNENKKAAIYNAELQRAIQANPFLASYSFGIGFQKSPAGGRVYDLTE